MVMQLEHHLVRVGREPGKCYCHFCGSEITTPSGDTFQRVTGWVEMRGSKNFRTEAREDLFAHRACLDIHRHGLAGQGALIA